MTRGSTTSGQLGGYDVGSRVVQRLNRRVVDSPPVDHAAARATGGGTPAHVTARRRAARRARRRTRQAQRRG